MVKQVDIETRNRLADSLDYAIRRFGADADETKESAIQFCRFIGLDPHSKFPVQQETKADYAPNDRPSAAPELPFEFQWQRIIKQVEEYRAGAERSGAVR